VIVVTRFRVDEGSADEFRVAAFAALDALAAQRGYADGQIGRNVDDPDLWLLTTTWHNVGSYRRALSSYDVRVTAVPLLSRAVDEPSAYETVEAGVATNTSLPRDLD
jgi:quinol monooxygenase YgiN